MTPVDVPRPVEITSIAELAQGISTQSQAGAPPTGRLMIAIAGPPGAGKSTAADGLSELLNSNAPGCAAVLPMDGFHYDDEVLNERGHRERKGAPHTFDVAGLAHMLKRIRANNEGEVAVPVFDRSIEIARAGARIIPQSVSFLIIEGNYLLLNDAPWSDLASLFDITAFVDVPEDELRRRLSRRWADLTPAAAHAKLEENDLPNARLVLANSRPADYRVVQPLGSVD